MDESDNWRPVCFPFIRFTPSDGSEDHMIQLDWKNVRITGKCVFYFIFIFISPRKNSYIWVLSLLHGELLFLAREICISFLFFFSFLQEFSFSLTSFFSFLIEKVNGLNANIFWYKGEWLASIYCGKNPFAGQFLWQCEKEGKDPWVVGADIFWRIWKHKNCDMPHDTRKCYMFVIKFCRNDKGDLLHEDDRVRCCVVL